MPTLTIGHVYYIIQYQDERLTVPVISSCTYKGDRTNASGERESIFALVGFAAIELSFVVSDLDNLILDLPAVIKELQSTGLAQNGIDHV